MSKAEDKALEAYPKMSRIFEPHGIIPADNKSHYLGDANEEKREGFIKGYHQALKGVIEWIEDNIGEYCYGDYLEFSAINIENIDVFDQKLFINDLRKAIK